MARNRIYDMARAKAADMGGAAARVPGAMIDKAVDMAGDRMDLVKAKLYIENYAMGNVDATEFAQAMADDDAMRHVVSDLCRLKLEPMNLELPQRSDRYIDVGAGMKTFWTEMKVPLPYEMNAARDIQNINMGIEAGKRSAGMPVKETPGEEQAVPKPAKRSLRDRINDAKKYMAEKAIEKLTPIVEDSREKSEVDESWLETEAGMEYKDKETRKIARKLENMAMDIEAGKSPELTAEDRKRALREAEVPEEKADEIVSDNQAELTSGYSREDLNRPLNEDMKHMMDGQEQLKSGYSAEDLNRPLSAEMQELFDQIHVHVDRGQKPDAQSQEADQKPQQEFRRHKNRVYGEFDGKKASIKNAWSGHEFTQDELGKLFAGEDITFTYTDNKNQEKTATGKLEWQTYNDRPYLGFKPDYSKKNVQSETQTEAADNSLFGESDQALMDYYENGGESGDYVQETDEDMARYYDRLGEDMADDMANYKPEDLPVCPAGEEETILTQDDLMKLAHESDGMTLGG